MLGFGLHRETDVEWWLRSFAARVHMPGGELEVFESTKLFFHLFWKLEGKGYTEQQIADYAAAWQSLSKLPREISLLQAVFELAEKHSLKASGPFCPFADA